MSIAEVRPGSLQEMLFGMGFNLTRVMEIEKSFSRRLGKSGPSRRKIGDTLTEDTLQQVLSKSIQTVMRKMPDDEIDALTFVSERES